MVDGSSLGHAMYINAYIILYIYTHAISDDTQLFTDIYRAI